MGWRNFDKNEEFKIWVLRVVNWVGVDEKGVIWKGLDELHLI